MPIEGLKKQFSPGPWVNALGYIHDASGIRPGPCLAEVKIAPHIPWRENAQLIAAAPDAVKLAELVLSIAKLHTGGPYNDADVDFAKEVAGTFLRKAGVM